MTLVTRVSLFFLLALGACLFGYSALLFIVVRSDLQAEFDQQLRSARDVLTAAIEVEDDDVKWQPSDHAVHLGDEQDAEEIRWVIVDEEGRVVDRSQNLSASHRDDLQRMLPYARTTDSPSDETLASQSWRFVTARLKANAPKPPSERDPDESAELTVVVGRNAASLHAELKRLFLLVCGLPLAFWMVAAIAGRMYCRKALAPVRAMATRAASAGETTDFNLRLPVASRKDELAELAIVFNELLDQLQQAYERQRRFAGDAAHQLRTPVTVLRGQIDVALRRPRDESSSRETLTLLRDQTAELQQILESL
ncbi:MAG: HAMP domain-containing protein, partial [Planctomycetaceae bacterium]|nr:HAMP domain-containing protein [Planctomycetaceae bacterium]